MEVPSALYLGCPSCEEETLHRVIKGKLGEKKQLTLDALVKCSQCGHRYNTVIKEEKPVTIPLILSEGADSKKDTIELASAETVENGTEYQLDRGTIKITGIETKRGRVESAKARDIATLWAKKFDRLKIRVSINKGRRTLSRVLWAVPEEEFCVGDVIRIKGDSVAIHSIKTESRHIKKGTAQARDIVRLYAKLVR
jgi:uncharacterized Zn finger protein